MIELDNERSAALLPASQTLQTFYIEHLRISAHNLVRIPQSRKDIVTDPKVKRQTETATATRESSDIHTHTL